MSGESKLLEEYLKGWKIKKASELVLNNGVALTTLMSFLHSNAPEIKLAAVMSLRRL